MPTMLAASLKTGGRVHCAALHIGGAAAGIVKMTLKDEPTTEAWNEKEMRREEKPTQKYVLPMDGKILQDQPRMGFDESERLPWTDEFVGPVGLAERATIWRRNGEEEQATEEEKRRYYAGLGKTMPPSLSTAWRRSLDKRDEAPR